MSALQYWLWLSSAGLSPRAKAAILERFGNAEAAFFAPEGEFASLPGVGRAEAAVLERRDLSLAEEVQAACEEQGLRILTMQDAAYPRRLRHVFSPPVVLYVKGRLPALDNAAAIAVIGTRKSSPYGLRMAGTLTTELVESGGVIVTPLTSPIELESARAALRAGGRIIAVLGVPHEREKRRIASEIAERGALVSEYPPFTRPLASFFRDRNRIAAGLSVGVLVVEAPEKSGTGLFVAEAAEQGKEIFAVPGNLDSESAAGTLKMLREGAHIATSGWDVLSEFEPLFPGELRRWESARKLAAPMPETEETNATDPPRRADPPGKEKSPGKEKPHAPEPLREKPKRVLPLSELNETQRAILTSIGEEAHIDEVIERSGLPTATVLGQITLLQIKGYLHAAPGRRFRPDPGIVTSENVD